MGISEKIVPINGKLANEFTKYYQEEILMEILIASAVVGGLAVRLGYNRWWTWLLLAAGFSASAYSFIHFFQYLPKSSFLLAAACAGLGAILPDLGHSFRTVLRRPITAVALLAGLMVGGLYYGVIQLRPDEQQQIGRMIGQLIVIAIMAYGIWLIIFSPFRRKKKK